MANVVPAKNESHICYLTITKIIKQDYKLLRKYWHRNHPLVNLEEKNRPIQRVIIDGELLTGNKFWVEYHKDQY